MGSFSIWHLLILGAIALVLFGGRGKVSDLMGDFGKGINSFKKGLAEGKEEPRTISSTETSGAAASKDKVSA
jgi:sec-independent protein translocase protein TatA